MGLAQNIKELRIKFDLSQTELGKIAGVTDKAVSTWENGTAEPRMGAIQKISDYFGITKSSIIEDIEPYMALDIGVRELSKPSNLTHEQREYVEKYFALNMEGRERIHVMINYEFAKQQGERKMTAKVTPSTENVINFPQETLTLKEPSLSVCAGTGNYLDDNIEWQDRLVLKNKYTYGADYIIKLQGDSMEPEFHDGDRLIVTDARGQNPIYGRVGIFIINGNAFFRQPLGNVLHPYNSKYDDVIPIESDDVRYVGYVVGIIDDSWVVG